MKDPGVNIAHMHDHALADDPWLIGDCQSNSDGQGYSDNGYLSMHICGSPSIGMSCQSYYGLFGQNMI